jgi:hypothetical protein
MGVVVFGFKAIGVYTVRGTETLSYVVVNQHKKYCIS